MSIMPPCKGCADRAVGCHGRCERYAEYRVRVEEIRRRRSLEIMVDSAHLDRAQKTVNRYLLYRKRIGK